MAHNLALVFTFLYAIFVVLCHGIEDLNIFWSSYLEEHVKHNVLLDPRFSHLSFSSGGHFYISMHHHVLQIYSNDFKEFRLSPHLNQPARFLKTSTDVDFYIRLSIPTLLEKRLVLCGYTENEGQAQQGSVNLLWFNLTSFEVERSLDYLDDERSLPVSLLCPDHVRNHVAFYLRPGSSDRDSLVYAGKMFFYRETFSPAAHMGQVSRFSLNLSGNSRSGDNYNRHVARSVSDDNFWHGATLGGPEFVAVFEVGPYVYFFLHDAEPQYLNQFSTGTGTPIRHAKVIRVCKDERSKLTMHHTSNVWSSLRQTLLECALPITPEAFKLAGSRGFVSILKSVVYSPTNSTFFTLFSGLPDSPAMSVLCAFTLADIDASLGKTMVQLTSTSGGDELRNAAFVCCWTYKMIAPPNPDSGTCNPASLRHVVSSDSFYDSPVRAALSVRSLYACASENYNFPLWFQYGASAERFVSWEVSRALDKGTSVYSIFLIIMGSGAIYRVSWQHQAQYNIGLVYTCVLRQARLLDVWSLDDAKNMGSLKDVYLKDNMLFLLYERAFVRLKATQCEHYVAWRRCVADPECGWDVDGGVCMDFTQRLCLSNCGGDDIVDEYKALEGGIVHFHHACLLPFAWFINGSLLSESTEDFVLTHNGSLIVPNVTWKHDGLEVRCKLRRESGDFVITDFNNNNVADDEEVASVIFRLVVEENHFSTAVNDWMDEFDKYKKAYNQWEKS